MHLFNPHSEKRPLPSQTTFGTVVESKQPMLLITAQLIPPETFLALTCLHLARRGADRPLHLPAASYHFHRWDTLDNTCGVAALALLGQSQGAGVA